MRTVSPGWIMMRPVNDATLVVLFEFAGEGDGVALPQIRHSWREIDVVRDQHRATRRKAHDETLVPGSVPIVGQHFFDDAFGLELSVGARRRR